MFKNYFHVALRNAFRHKSYSLVNVLGLAGGLAVCLLIFLVVRYESSFDNWHAKRDHIYRVVSLFKFPTGPDYEPGVAFPTASTLRKDYPQLKSVASLVSFGPTQVNPIGESEAGGAPKMFKEPGGVLYAEPAFLSMFDFGFTAGDRERALQEPNTVLLTQAAALKYFGGWQQAMGKALKLENGLLVRVTGILNDPPPNTDFPLKVLVSYSSLQHTWVSSFNNNWTATFAQHYCFVELPDGLSAATVNKDLADMIQRYKPEGYKHEGMLLLPLKDMHFDTRYATFTNHPFSKNLLWGLSLIGLFVLAIACVNFVNLATAQAVNRSKEVGIRKVLGGWRTQLLAQFLTEAALYVLLALVLAVGLCSMVLPPLNRALNMQIDGSLLGDGQALGVLSGLFVVCTLLSGLYPAFVLSAFNPVTALTNKTRSRLPAVFSLRKVLVVLQFTIAEGLIVGVLIIMMQMDYFRSAPMGFRKDAVLITRLGGGGAKTATLRNQLMQLPGVADVSLSVGSPMDDNDRWTDITFNKEKKTGFGVNLKWGDARYPVLFGMQLAAGRFYTAGDTIRELVVNETFVKRIGLRDPAAALGSLVGVGGREGKIVGVVKDFNVASMREAVSPVVMGTWSDTYETANIQLRGAHGSEALAGIAAIFKTAFPESAYEYHWLDDTIGSQYEQEAQLTLLYKIFAGIAIFISCLGLYSLVSFMAVQRAKEVAIRKTLGASVGQVVYLLSKEFTVLVGIAFLLAAPLSWYFMHRWLENYAYHIQPGAGVFILAVVLSMGVAWLSVGYRSWRAAVMSPVKNLKTE